MGRRKAANKRLCSSHPDSYEALRQTKKLKQSSVASQRECVDDISKANTYSGMRVSEDYLHRPHLVFTNENYHEVSDENEEDEGCLALLPRLPQYRCHMSQVPVAATQLKMAPREVHKVRPHQRDAVAALVDWDGDTYLSECVWLPCGNGKTLVGVLAVTIMQCRTLVVCSTLEQVEQWERQFVRWTLLPKKLV